MATIRQVLADAHTQLSEVSETPHLEARLLLSEILQRSTAWLFSHQEDVMSLESYQQFATMLSQRATGYPLAYILGKRGFYHWDFTVTPDVLIPRPETELLVEKAVERAKECHPDGDGLKIVDVGTGSGIIAISLAQLLPQAQVLAIDISSEALGVAQYNADQIGTPNIRFLQGNLLEPLDLNTTVDLITANLPYIPTEELKSLAVSRWEPQLALDGGVDGLQLIHKLLKQSLHYLNEGSSVFLEIGADQGFAVKELAYKMFPKAVVSVYQDLANLDRVVVIENWETVAWRK